MRNKQKTLDAIIRVGILLPFTIVMLPIYTLAYVISHLLKLRDYENMETPLEFATIWCNTEDYYIFEIEE